MTPKAFLTVSAAVAALVLGGCAGAPVANAFEAPGVAADIEQSYALSAPALRTARARADSYKTPDAAVKAGDMAAYLTLLSERIPEDADGDPLGTLYLALDRVAADDLDGARAILEQLSEAAEGDGEGRTGLHDYVEAWLLALEGKPDEAIELHRAADNDMPGLTGDLSLAAMLEALGRQEQAMAVYEAMTPTRIEAPEHQFDPKGLLYSHVRTVVSRHALLAQRLGRIDEAKAIYKRLADAEPEEAASYAAALESLETGKNLDNEALDVRGAFSQSMADLSRTLQEQRIIRLIMMGGRPDGFDVGRSAFDQAALLIAPDDDGLRAAVIDQMYDYALYDAVAHVALTGPEQTASLQIAAAQALVMSGQNDAANAAIETALKISDEDSQLQTLYGALQLRTLMLDRTGAKALIDDLLVLAENDAERASAHGLAATVYGQFGDPVASAAEARKARDLDDTHDRRMMLADALGKMGEIDEALRILRTERLARPNDPYTLNSLGYFLLQHTDKYEESYRVLHRANALAPNDPYIADSYGWALFKLGNLPEAKRALELSRQELLPHRHWEIEDHLGDVYWYLGEEDQAREAWAAALENRPPDTVVESIETKVAEGLTAPAPERRALPNLSLDSGQIEEQDI